MGHVILVHPNPGAKDTEYQILPLGLLYVAAPLVAQGHSVTAIDQRKDPDWRESLRKAINQPKTLCVGVSTMTGPQIQHALDMAAEVRRIAPGLPIVWGGVHPSLLPEQTAAHPLVDIVAFGEGETCFPPLVDALEKGNDWHELAGLCYRRKDGMIVRNADAPVPDLEEIPELPYDIFDLSQYHVGALRSGPSLPMVTSRGCRFRCAYCYIQEFFKRTWRGLSPEKVIAEFKRLIYRYKAEGIFLLDDFFFQNRKRAADILQGLIDNDIHVNLYNANARADFLYRSSDEYLKLMADAGIKTLFVGTEAGNDQTLKDMLKDISTEQVLEVNKRLAAVGIKAVYSFMAGMPGESEEQVMDTLSFMLRLKEENRDAMLYSVNLFVPFPGTHYFNWSKDLGCRFPETLEGWAVYDYNTVNLSYLSEDFKRFLRKAEGISAFLDVDGKTGRLAAPFVKAYSRIARSRVRSRAYKWVPELPIIQFARNLRRA